MTLDAAALLRLAPLAAEQYRRYLRSDASRTLDRLVRSELEDDPDVGPQLTEVLLREWDHLRVEPGSAVILDRLLRHGQVAQLAALRERASQLLDGLETLPWDVPRTVDRLVAAVGNNFVAAQKDPQAASQRAASAVLSALEPAVIERAALRLAARVHAVRPPLRSPFTARLPKREALRRSPRPLLLSEHRVVPLVGRGDELAALEEWAEGLDDVAVLGLSGAGGSGKTRLATELAFALARRRPAQWTVGLIDRNVALDERDLEAIAGVAGDVLVIVDYAELRTREVPLLLERACARTPGAGRFRLVVIARGQGRPERFWAPFSRGGLAGVIVDEAEPPLVLGPADLTATVRSELWRQAAGAFARELGPQPPATPPADLAHASFSNPLAIAALALARTVEKESVADLDSAWERLVEREDAYWAAASERTGVAVPRRRARRVTALAGLVRPRTRRDCEVALGVLPELAGASRGELEGLADWLHACYPGRDGAHAVGLQPDLLAERLIATELLGEDPVDVGALLSRLGDLTHVGRIADALARTHQSQPTSRAAISAIVDAALERLVAAASAAGEADAPIALLVAAAASPNRAALIANQAGYDAPATATMLACSRHAVAWARPFGGMLIQVLFAHVLRLRRHGLRDEALEAVDEAIAVAHRDAPIAEAPSHVARFTSLRGVVLAEQGRTDKAIAAEREAIALWRGVAEPTFDDHHGLANSLMNLGLWLSEAGDSGGALEATLEGAVLQLDLFAAGYPGGREGLIELLGELGAVVSALRGASDGDDAIPKRRRALLSYRTELNWLLGDPGPRDLVKLLVNLSILLARDGRRERALRASSVAVELGERLGGGAAANRALLASALTEHGNRLVDDGRVADAFEPLERAAAMFRTLAAEDPGYREALAIGLSNLSLGVGRDRSRLAEAIEVSQGALDLVTELSARGACHPDRLALCLSNHGVLLGEDDGRLAEAIGHTRAALDEYRRLTETNARYRADVARNQQNLESYSRRLAERDRQD
jgi:tetratricopeptide (TPR) repeat protein